MLISKEKRHKNGASIEKLNWLSQLMKNIPTINAKILLFSKLSKMCASESVTVSLV